MVLPAMNGRFELLAIAATLLGCAGDERPAGRDAEVPTTGEIAFTGTRGGGFATWVVRADGSGLRRLSDPRQVAALGPVWSPDGTRIAFSGYRDVDFSGGADYHVYVMRADGSEVRDRTRPQAHSGVTAARVGAWSPDGTRIAFAGSDGRGEDKVYVAEVDGPGPIQLTRGPALDSSPAWAPDGASIAFVRTRAERESSIYTIAPDGTGLRRLTDSEGIETEPTWSPDGTMIAFIGGRHRAQLHVIDADGTGRRSVSAGSGTSAESPVWSPDGTRIAFQAYDGHDWDLYVARSDGSREERLTDQPGDDVGAAWSPDGTQLAFERSDVPSSVRDNAGTFEVYVMSANGRGLRRLTQNVGALGGGVSWKPGA
jgi:TolB protein